MNTWHRFTASTVDDSECANRGCEVVVADEALRSFIVGCPAPKCTASGHEGESCVFVPADPRPVCSYCESSGFPELDREDLADREDLDGLDEPGE